MKGTNLLGIVAGALLVPSIGLADFVYTGVEVSYVDVEFNNGLADLDGDGYRFSGSLELNDRFFLLGEIEDQSYDLGIDGSAYEVGVGFHHPFGSTFDFVGTASFVQAEVEFAGFGADDDGIALGGGVRAQLADSFEVEASLQYVNLDQGGSDTGIELRGRYYFTERFAFSLETDLDDDVDTLSFGFRAEF
jgi:hypothetical protein